MLTQRFPRAEFSLFHLEVWRRHAGVHRVIRVRYTRTEAVVVYQ